MFLFLECEGQIQLQMLTIQHCGAQLEVQMPPERIGTFLMWDTPTMRTEGGFHENCASHTILAKYLSKTEPEGRESNCVHGFQRQGTYHKHIHPSE